MRILIVEAMASIAIEELNRRRSNVMIAGIRIWIVLASGNAALAVTEILMPVIRHKRIERA